jgi:hypothetical protein
MLHFGVSRWTRLPCSSPFGFNDTVVRRTKTEVRAPSNTVLLSYPSAFPKQNCLFFLLFLSSFCSAFQEYWYYNTFSFMVFWVFQRISIPCWTVCSNWERFILSPWYYIVTESLQCFRFSSLKEGLSLVEIIIWIIWAVDRLDYSLFDLHLLSLCRCFLISDISVICRAAISSGFQARNATYSVSWLFLASSFPQIRYCPNLCNSHCWNWPHWFGHTRISLLMCSKYAICERIYSL